MFLVVVHDVTTEFFAPVAQMLHALRPLVGRAVAAAVVPHWHGQPGINAELAALVREHCGEVLLHGCTHQTACWWHPLAVLTGQANEFSRLALPAALARLQIGRALLRRWFAAPVAGFVPPAWQSGPLNLPALARCGLHYGLYFSCCAATSGARWPLATWSWDTGRLAWPGLVGEWLGTARALLLPRAVPCVVLHPADVARGYLERALERVRMLLAAGRRPLLPMQLVAALDRSSDETPA